MAGRAEVRPSVITDARISTSLSTEQRTRRYLITMGIRVAAFLAAVVTPFPYNVILLLSAAILPGFAVLLGNASDNHRAPVAPPSEPATLPEIVAGDIVSGTVAEDAEAADGVHNADGDKGGRGA